MSEGLTFKALKDLADQSEKELVHILGRAFTMLLARHVGLYKTFDPEHPVCAFADVLWAAKNTASQKEKVLFEIVSRFRAETIFKEFLNSQPLDSDINIRYRSCDFGKRLLLFVEQE